MCRLCKVYVFVSYYSYQQHHVTITVSLYGFFFFFYSAAVMITLSAYIWRSLQFCYSYPASALLCCHLSVCLMWVWLVRFDEDRERERYERKWALLTLYPLQCIAACLQHCCGRWLLLTLLRLHFLFLQFFCPPTACVNFTYFFLLLTQFILQRLSPTQLSSFGIKLQII